MFSESSRVTWRATPTARQRNDENESNNVTPSDRFHDDIILMTRDTPDPVDPDQN